MVLPKSEAFLLEVHVKYMKKFFPLTEKSEIKQIVEFFNAKTKENTGVAKFALKNSPFKKLLFFVHLLLSWRTRNLYGDNFRKPENTFENGIIFQKSVKCTSGL